MRKQLKTSQLAPSGIAGQYYAKWPNSTDSPVLAEAFSLTFQNNKWSCTDIDEAFGVAVSLDLVTISSIPNDTSFMVRATVVAKGDTNIDRTYCRTVVAAFYKDGAGIITQKGAAEYMFPQIGTLTGTINLTFNIISANTDLEVSAGTSLENAHWSMIAEVLTARDNTP